MHFPGTQCGPTCTRHLLYPLVHVSCRHSIDPMLFRAHIRVSATLVFRHILWLTSHVRFAVQAASRLSPAASSYIPFPALPFCHHTVPSQLFPTTSSYYDAFALGYLRLNVRQGPFSLTSVEEVRWVDRPRRPRQKKKKN